MKPLTSYPLGAHLCLWQVTRVRSSVPRFHYQQGFFIGLPSILNALSSDVFKFKKYYFFGKIWFFENHKFGTFFLHFFIILSNFVLHYVLFLFSSLRYPKCANFDSYGAKLFNNQFFYIIVTLKGVSNHGNDSVTMATTIVHQFVYLLPCM